MKKIWFLIQGLAIAQFAPYAYTSNEVKCLCRDRSVIAPECGICGQNAGTMEKTVNGVKCYCENKLLNEEISCESTCNKNGGWTGEFRE